MLFRSMVFKSHRPLLRLYVCDGSQHGAAGKPCKLLEERRWKATPGKGNLAKCLEADSLLECLGKCISLQANDMFMPASIGLIPSIGCVSFFRINNKKKTLLSHFCFHVFGSLTKTDRRSPAALASLKLFS